MQLTERYLSILRFVATVSPPMAEQIRRYGKGSGASGGGMSFQLGGGDPSCPSR